MERRIILFLVFKAFMQSIHGQSPMLDIDRDSTSEGSSFTLNCSVVINDAITFKLDNVTQGSCAAPFLGVLGSCMPTIITQSLADSVTSWTITPALIEHRGSWICTRGTTDSNEVTLKLYKLPVVVLTQNGISSDITVNDTSSYPISIEVGCLFSENGPTVELEFVAAGSTIASASMSCSNSSTACSACTGCSAYSCSHDINVNQGSITIETPYTLQIKVGVTGTTQTFSSAVFSPHSITFKGTSPTSQISTAFSIERSTAVKMYSSSNVTTPMSITGITPTSYIPATTTSHHNVKTSIIYMNTDTSTFFAKTETDFVNVDTESTTPAANTEMTKLYTNTETTNLYAKSEFTMSYANTETTNLYDDIETTIFSTDTETNTIKKETSGLVSKRMLSDQSVYLTTAATISGSSFNHSTSRNMTALFESPGYSVLSYNEITSSTTLKTNHVLSWTFSDVSIPNLMNTQHDHLTRTFHVISGSLVTQDSSTNTVLSLTILPSHVVETYIATLSNLFLVQTVSTDTTVSVYEITNTSGVSRFSLSTETGKTLTTISHVDSNAASTVCNSGRSARLMLSLSMNDNSNQQIVTTIQSPLMPTSSSFDISLYSSNMLDPHFSPNRHSLETIVTLPKNIVSNTLRSSLFDTMEHFINTKTISITSNVVDTNIPLNYLTNVYQTISQELTASYPTSLKDSFQAIDHSLSLQTSAAIRTELTSSSCSGSLTFDDPVFTSVSSGIFISLSTVSTITKSGISEKTKNVLFIGTLSALVTFIIVVLLTLVFVKIYLSKDNVKPQKKNDDISWSDKSRSPMTAFPDYSFTGGNIHTRLNTSSISFKMYPYENNWNNIT